jgi:hypothetical protein
MAHETPGDSRVRALPSPVCTGWPGRQSHPVETVIDRGKRPAKAPSTTVLQLSILQGLSLTFPALTSVICCPSAAQATPCSRRSRPELRGVRLSAGGGHIVRSSASKGCAAARIFDLVVGRDRTPVCRAGKRSVSCLISVRADPQLSFLRLVPRTRDGPAQVSASAVTGNVGPVGVVSPACGADVSDVGDGDTRLCQVVARANVA